MPGVTEGVKTQVESLRKKLLDLTLRNRMLNYRPSARLGLTIVDESAVELYRIVVEEGKRMSFVGRPDPPRTSKTIGKEQLELLATEDELLAKAKADAKEELETFLGSSYVPIEPPSSLSPERVDTKLGTTEYQSVLPGKLRGIQREAALANEELGINTLFLTLGMLQWSENETKSYRAPLLYVPVRLESQANGATRLVYEGSDVGENLPLRAKLNEFGLRLPEFDDEKPIEEFFGEVELMARSQLLWEVRRDEVCLGFFNYEKYAMYVDLSGDAWGEESKPWNHPDVVAMLGTGYPPIASPVNEETFLDDVRAVAEGREVYDADSSQTLAMIRAASGLSMVIEGPPGTGKSQTITNIISEAVAAGKTVLFVSAKRAALDVVKRRLEDADLGPICLDLHDKLTNRREFYAEIRRTIENPIAVKSQEDRVTRLAELRNRLNDHCAAMNDELPEFGLSPFTAVTRLARLPSETPEDRGGRVSFESLGHWRIGDIEARMPFVRTLQERLGLVGVPLANPYWGCALEHLDPALRIDIQESLREATEALRHAVDKVADAAKAFAVPAPTIGNVDAFRTAVELAQTAPADGELNFEGAAWSVSEAKLREYVDALRISTRIRSTRAGQVQPSAFETDWTATAQRYDEHGGKWYRFLIGDFRAAQRSLRAVLTGGPQDVAGQRELLRDLMEAFRAERVQQSHREVVAATLGSLANGSVESVGKAFDWGLRVSDLLASGKLPQEMLSFLRTAKEPSLFLLFAEAAESALAGGLKTYRTAAETLRYPLTGVVEETAETLYERARRWEEGQARLPAYVAYREARRQVEEQGLASVIELADRWELASERLSDALLRSYLTGIMRQAIGSRPALRSFERISHERMIDEFGELDDFKLRYNRAQVRMAHQRGLPTFANAVGNLQQLKIQCELKIRHKPIRWIMARAGSAVQRIKPVFMMSPLSVAIHLPPELPPFDLVIFDEASQVKPEDALSAIIRANQAIVVGDTRQMPPTSFFDRIADEEEIDVDVEEAAELGREAAKIESVLSLMSAVTLDRTRRPDLRWHYRSLHPDLIEPSNVMFYENRLVVFPSAGDASTGRQLGLVFHHNPVSVYEGGAKKRINPREAEEVADAVVRHVRERADESLMVAAMNKAQADLIYEEVAKRMKQNAAAFEAFEDAHPHEPLAIKNLENVQGDERDVVFISVTYGRDATGNIRQQFGPLLQDGGERRLNVLISRARLRCEVFSNFTASDLRTESGRPGVKALQRYLGFAQNKHLEGSASAPSEEETPFAHAVAEKLRERLLPVETEVGSVGYRVDVAVAGENPGEYRLGIESDGPSYRRARSARDRDKLRRRVLENRGWHLHRLWANDWWQDREAEVARIVMALEEEPQASAATTSPEPGDFIEAVSGTASTTARPYVVAPEATEITSEDELGNYLREVVTAEGPICHELLLLRLRQAAGLTRTTRDVRDSLDALISEAVLGGAIRQVGDAYFTEEVQLEAPRDWSDRPAREKKTEFVPDVELDAALLSVIGQSYGIAPDEAIRAGFNLLGFRRTSEDAIARARDAIEALVAEGQVRREGSVLYYGAA